MSSERCLSRKNDIGSGDSLALKGGVKKLNIEAAPIIHARLKDLDFPPKLLVAPEDFTSEDISVARSYITANTYQFEMSAEKERKLFALNDKFLIIGLSTTMEKLYRYDGRETQYNKVDRGRVNFGFVGAVIRKKDISQIQPFRFPYTLLIKYYEECMGKYWTYTKQITEPFRSQYQEQQLEESLSDINISKDRTYGKTIVLDENEFSSDQIIVCFLDNIKKINRCVYCSDVHSISMLKNGNFDVISSFTPSIFDVPKAETQNGADQRQLPVNYGKTDPEERISAPYRNRKKEKLILLFTAGGIGVLLFIFIISRLFWG